MPNSIDPGLFKGYDVRGIYGQNLDEAAAELIGKAYGSTLSVGSSIFIGADPRTHSPPLSAAFAKGVLSTGVSVVDAGMVPTPLLTYLLATREANGVEITASHLAPQFNGIKMYYSGVELSSQEMTGLLDAILKGKFRQSGNSTLRSESFNLEYVNFLSSKIKVEGRVKVVVDTGNGACGLVAGAIYEKLGCDVTKLFWEPDGTFPNHLANPHKEETLDAIKASVVAEEAHFGIALDADGDRVAFIDELGNKVRTDDAALLFAMQALMEQPGSNIICDVRMTNALSVMVPKWGGKLLQSQCGRTFVGKLMRETGAAFAAEQSGHSFFKDFFYHDDAIFAGAKMTQLLSSSDLTLSQLVAQLPHYPCTPEMRITVGNDFKYSIVNQAIADFTGASQEIGAKVNSIDGVRLEFADGSWGLLRVSNTEPMLSMRFEGPTPESLSRVYAFFRDYLDAKGVAMPSEPPK